jgi:metal-responsive CopG/Arc/MetJ family transcriptional regulator
MPTIQIYLNQELFDFVKKEKSKIIQQALQDYIEKLRHSQNRQNKTPETPVETED